MDKFLIMFENLEKYNIILGSNSPRRKELLTDIGLKFSTKKIDCEENYPDSLKSSDIPIYLAKEKADNYHLKDNDLLITADTVVSLDNEILGKPSDYEEAVNMLKKLSGKFHYVYSGVCIKTFGREILFGSETKVKFVELDNDIIENYIKTYKPYDKAGAYGIQEWIGKIGVESIDGSFYNVMGLPVCKLINELRKV